MMIAFNDNWTFSLDSKENFAPINVPHDWLIGDVNNLYRSGIGWYRKEFDSDLINDGQQLFLHFDGVYMDTTIYVNDKEVGQWKYGYTAFEFNITEFLISDYPNVILVKVQHDAPNSRWYTGAGIYRDVHVRITNPYYIKQDGIYISTSKKDRQWVYDLNVEVETEGQPYEIKHTLLPGPSPIIPWSILTPQLYTLRIELYVNGEITDTHETTFGFRTMEFTTDKGFFLNGEYLKLHGVCLHHDLGGLGSAVHKDAIYRQLSLLKKMGVNSIRISHNPSAKAFMEIADEMGFLIISELLDMWKRPKNIYDYARFFDDWIEKDVASWVRRDRNHPSLMMWSIGNEIYDTHADHISASKTMLYLMKLVQSHDPKTNAEITFGSNYMPWENTQICADLIKFVGYNYAERFYSDHHSTHPDWIIYGSETCSTVQSRGIYHFPLSQSILSDDDLQCSTLGNSSTSWGAKNIETCLITDKETVYSLGQFIWAGQDYLGEPTPYHTKNSYLGHIDTAGLPKDSYYLFQAAWTSYKENPMIHILPYWDFSNGQEIDVRIYSNAPIVELFLNGESLGIQHIKDKYIGDWQVAYTPGTLHGIAYDHNHHIIAQSYRNSFSDTTDLLIEKDTYDQLTYVTISAIDCDGNSVENANNRVQVSVQNGKLLSLDNGDATDYEQYISSNRRLFNGKIVAIIWSDTNNLLQITATLDSTDIPIRKVEIIQEGCILSAIVYPPNTTYDDLMWRATDAAGIDSPLCTLEVSTDKKSAKLIELGDGDIYIRCSPKNGKEHLAFISMIKRTITGKGNVFLNPYHFISGGLYTKSSQPLTNGNERGVATLRDGSSHVLFQHLDFGNYGTDEITLPLFPLENDPFTFEVWENHPTNNGEYICTLTYDKGSIWNTYQEVTYTLPRRLSGVTDLCFVFNQKVHIKGFSFTKKEKAYQRLYASECNKIYGDSYSIQGKAVEKIGNNVTLIFDEMDFGTSSPSGITLCWRSIVDRNSMQLIVSDSKGEQTQMIEITNSTSYCEKTFPLDSTFTGKKTVSLVFLPGTNLDLKWIQFSVYH